MSSNNYGTSRKRDHDEYIRGNTPGHSLFVTGQTPTPAPETPSRLSSGARFAIPRSVLSQLDAPDLPLFETLEDGADEVDEFDDDDDESEDEGNVKMVYQASDEDPPKHIAFDDRFHSLVDRSKKCASDLEGCLQPFRSHSGDIAQMHSRAQTAQVAPEPEKPMIMLLGETGTGKSSTTNSFVDNLDATRTAASGESCTSVPTLLIESLPWQTKTYAAEVRFLDVNTRRDFLREQLQHYNRYRFAQDPMWSDEERNEYEALCSTAEKTLRSIFCDHWQFESPGNTRNFLNRCYESSTETQTLDVFDDWCSQLFNGSQFQHDENGPFFRVESDNIVELNGQVDPHIFAKANAEEVALFSLVEHATKALQDSYILRFVDLLDLPGDSDANRVRTRIAHKFITKADALWTIADIGRILSKAKFDTNLATYGERFGDNVVAIATNTDANIKDATMKDLQQRGYSIREWDELGQSIKRKQAEAAKVDKQLSKSTSTKRLRTSTHKSEAELSMEKVRLEKEIRERINEQFDVGVEIRNSYVSRRLKEDKQRHLRTGSTLATFCVSNPSYGLHKGDQDLNARRMKVETTQIPALRAHAMMMAAPGRFSSLSAVLDNVFVALDGVRLWTETTPAERLEGLMSIVKGPAALLEVSGGEYRKKSEGLFKNNVIGPLISRHFQFEAQALRVATEIRNWPWNTAGAFFRRYGKHQTDSKSYEVWNERFTEDQTDTINAKWDIVLAQQFNAMDAGMEKVEQCVKELPEELSKSANALPIPIGPLTAMIAGYVSRIERIHQDRKAAQRKELKNIKMNATKDLPTAYFTKAMVPMYDWAKDDSGTGVKKRRADLLHDFLRGRHPASQSPFINVSDELKKDLTDAINWTARILESDVKDILNDMERQFEAVLKEHAQTHTEMAARVRLNQFFALKNSEIYSIKADFVQLKSEYGMELTLEEEQYRSGA